MTEVKNTQTLGIKINTGSYGADVITAAATEYYKLGTFYQSFGEFINDKRELHFDLTGAYRYPRAVTVAKHMVSGGITSTAVNAMPLYLAMGKYTSDGVTQSQNVNQLDLMDFDSILPEFVVRNEDYNSTVGMYAHNVGCYVQNLNTAIDLRQPGNYLTYNSTIAGQRTVTPGFAGASTAGKLVYPGSEDNEYKLDNNTVLNWGGTFASHEYSSGGDAIINELIDISLMIDNSLIPRTPNGQQYPKKFQMGYQIPAFSMTIDRREYAQLSDDFQTMADGTTTKNVYFKIYQSADDYMEWHIENFMIQSIKAPNVQNNENRYDQVITGNMAGLRVKEYSTNVDGDTYYV